MQMDVDEYRGKAILVSLKKNKNSEHPAVSGKIYRDTEKSLFRVCDIPIARHCVSGDGGSSLRVAHRNQCEFQDLTKEGLYHVKS